MSRTLHATVHSQMGAASVGLAELLELKFPAGTIRVTTAERSITWGGNVYTANALLQSYDGVAERNEIKSRPVRLVLDGTDATAFARLTAATYHFAEVNLYIVALDEAGALLGDPVPIAEGLLMSAATILADKGSLVIELSAEGPEILAARDSANLATPEAQRRRYPGDTGLDSVSRVSRVDITWGGPPRRVGGTGSNGGPVGPLPPVNSPDLPGHNSDF